MKTSTQKYFITIYFLILIFLIIINNLSFFNNSEILFLGKRINIRNYFIKYKKSDQIVIINIDQRSIDKYGRWPWKRKIFADFIDRINSKDIKAKAVIFDLIFSGSDKEFDNIFAESARRAGNIIFSAGFDPSENDSKRYYFRMPCRKLYDIDPVNPNIGSVIRNSSPDQKIISMPVIYNYFNPYTNNRISLYPVELKTLEVLNRKSAIKMTGNFFTIADHKIPLIKNGIYSFLINYPVNCKKIFDNYSFCDVMYDMDISKKLSGKIIFVINKFEPNDRFQTTNFKTFFGGEIHACALNTILERNFIIPSTLSSDIILILFIWIITFLILNRIRKRYIALILVICLGIIYLVLNIFVFVKYALWIPAVMPLTGILLFTVAQFAAERYLMGKTVEKLLPDSFNDRIKTGIEVPDVNIKNVYASVLFSDIRGYTNLAEEMSSEKVMDMLNIYHRSIKDAIKKYGGEIFDFQGDAFMVVFGADAKTEDHALKAVNCAVEIKNISDRINDENIEKGLRCFEIGVGVSTGEIALGFMGHGLKLQPAAIGDTTNIAARLQAKSSELGYSVLITKSTHDAIAGKIQDEYIGKVILKGKKEPQEIYGLMKSDIIR